MPEAVALRHLLHFGAGIGDGHEPASRFLSAHGPLHTLKEVLFEDVGLERRSGLAGNDEESFRQIDPLFERLHLRRIGRVKHVQAREARHVAKSLRQNFRTEARSTHPQKENVGKPLALHFAGQLLERIAMSDLALDNAQPAEPFRLVGACPKRCVALPQPADFVRGAPLLYVHLDRVRERVRELEGQLADHRRTGVAELFFTASSSLSNASAKRRTPSSVSLSVTSFIEMPTAATVCMILAAPARSSVRLGRGWPCSRKASNVAGGIVFTVSGPINSST